MISSTEKEAVVVTVQFGLDWLWYFYEYAQACLVVADYACHRLVLAALSQLKDKIKYSFVHVL